MKNKKTLNIILIVISGIIFVAATAALIMQFVPKKNKYEKYKNKLNKGGTIIIDNIDLKVTNQIESEKKKIKYQHIAEETKEYFENVKDFSVTYLDIGDGLIILK